MSSTAKWFTVFMVILGVLCYSFLYAQKCYNTQREKNFVVPSAHVSCETDYPTSYKDDTLCYKNDPKINYTPEQLVSKEIEYIKNRLTVLGYTYTLSKKPTEPKYKYNVLVQLHGEWQAFDAFTKEWNGLEWVYKVEGIYEYKESKCREPDEKDLKILKLKNELKLVKEKLDPNKYYYVPKEK